MKAKLLLVNYDTDALETYASLLDNHGISSVAVPTMALALENLVSGEYSGVVINADNFEYLPLLKTMRALTTVPIGIATTSYDADEHDHAVCNGADVYRVRYDAPKYRAKGFATIVKIYLKLCKDVSTIPSSVAHKGVQVFPEIRKVIANEKELNLQPLEIGILYYLILNKGRILSHDQIYNNVWGQDYTGSPREAMWSSISKLRKKLRTEANVPDFIKTERGIGYRVE